MPDADMAERVEHTLVVQDVIGDYQVQQQGAAGEDFLLLSATVSAPLVLLSHMFLSLLIKGADARCRAPFYSALILSEIVH